MKKFPKLLSSRRHWRWLVALTVIAGGGCSGINASKSISPLDFILPGLHVQTEPAAPLPNGTNSVFLLSGVGLQM
jgi:hypothetical protein